VTPEELEMIKKSEEEEEKRRAAAAELANASSPLCCDSAHSGGRFWLNMLRNAKWGTLILEELIELKKQRIN
jgi:hypothetical protein